MAKPKKINYTYAVGKRKTATARVRLFKGKGESTVNSLPMDKYFGNDLWKKPFGVLDVLEKYFVTVRVVGGGKKGQLDAVIHGISRAFSKESVEKFRGALKKSGLLSRDSRVRERRKVGTGGKARRQKQSPKR